MPFTDKNGSRLPDWLLTLGGGGGLVLGILVLLRGRQPLIHRSSALLIALCFLCLGLGGLIEAQRPGPGSQLKFAGKLFAGFALFSISWAISHP